ncbi:MAG: hypothetical protein A3K13_01035 [Gemmatimonadetes bacterium RIFCSPLOWO2_12_FULL_68_9]|nr:MAG: hypothetical protein A3K13_01035 [Gemmatimonadetes bacterium RIFCSPLOWO2_12_FULL_68_9]
MSLAIDVAKVRSVLLADGWHRVAENSFAVDAYEYVKAGVTQSGGNGSTGPVGFRFKDDAGYVLSGPLSAILASQATS